ncbi:MAG: LamG domain-containing protein, partial [Candidatus Pacearchaeota archaeon]
GYWSFDEGSGTTAKDLSGNNNNGTLINGPQWVDGKVGKALSFDGVDDYVRVNNSPGSPLFSLATALTYEVWIKPSSDQPYSFRPLIERQQCNNAWPSKELGLSGTAPFNVRFLLNYQDSNTFTTFIASSAIQADGWSHIGVTYDKSTSFVKIYVDSNNVLSSNYSQTLWEPSTPLWIGGIPYPVSVCWQNYTKSIIDEVRIYNRALSADEIKALYEATK